jgi:hypothetical protein
MIKFEYRLSHSLCFEIASSLFISQSGACGMNLSVTRHIYPLFEAKIIR